MLNSKFSYYFLPWDNRISIIKKIEKLYEFVTLKIISAISWNHIYL